MYLPKLLVIAIIFTLSWLPQAYAMPTEKCEEALHSNNLSSDDAYEILGISPDANEKEIKSAYKAAVKAFHPDIGGDNASIRKVIEAYERLKKKPTIEMSKEPEDIVEQIFRFKRTVWIENPTIRVFGRAAEFAFVFSPRMEPAKNDFSDYAALFEEAYLQPETYLTKNFERLVAIMGREITSPASQKTNLLPAEINSGMAAAFKQSLKERLTAMFRDTSGIPVVALSKAVFTDNQTVDRYKSGDLSVGLSTAAVLLQALPFALERTYDWNSNAMADLKYRVSLLNFARLEIGSKPAKRTLDKSLPGLIAAELHPVTFLRQTLRWLLLQRSHLKRESILQFTSRQFQKRFGGSHAHYLAFLLIYGADHYQDPLLFQSESRHRPTLEAILTSLKEDLGISRMLAGKEAADMDKHMEGIEFYLEVLSYADQHLLYASKLANSVYWTFGSKDFFEKSLIRQEYSQIKARMRSTAMGVWLNELELSKHEGLPLEKTALRFGNWFEYVPQ